MALKLNMFYWGSRRLSGKNISKAEVLNISSHGMWIMVQEQEFYVPFSQFPWFIKATIEQIYHLEFFHEKHLHWPDLDVDIELASLKNPAAYPLQYS